MVRDFFEGLQKIQINEIFWGQHTFPFNNHGTSESWGPWRWQSFPVQNWHFPFQNQKAVWVFQHTLIIECEASVFAQNSSVCWIQHVFFHVLVSTDIYAQRPIVQSRSFPTLGALCDFLHLLGLTLQGVVSLCFFRQEVISDTHLVIVVDDLLRFHGFVCSTTCRIKK